MFEGRPPYSEIHPMRAIFMIPTKPPPQFKEGSTASEPFKAFLAKCLVKDPSNRLSAASLLDQDPFIKSSTQLKPNLYDLIEKVNAHREMTGDIG
jgi:serine/threonine kinase 3